MNLSFSPRLAFYAGLTLAAACAPPPPTPGLPSHVPLRVQGAIDRGPVARDEVIRFVIGLKLHDQHLLPSARRGPGLGERRLAPDEFADRFAASADDYQQLVDWLVGHELTVVRTSPGRTTVTAEGTARAVERAFATELRQYEDQGGFFRAPSDELTLGDAGPTVGGIVGLDSARRWHSHVSRSWSPVPSPYSATGGLAPADLAARYGTDSIMQKGEGETVAILGTGPPPTVMGDVSGFMTNYNLPSQPAQYTQILLGGALRDAPNNGEYFENVLDFEMVLSMAPKATIKHVITSTNTPGLFTDGMSFIVNQLPQAHSVSLSWGSCERGAASEMPVVNVLMAQARAEGQQWFAASGDSGTDGCRDGKGNQILSAGWPASSPSIIGVGGTQIAFNGTEVVWGGGRNPNGGGGSGISESNDKPAYQMGLNPFANDGARHEPDVSALAGAPGVEIYLKGQTTVAEGTSAAAPIWAGVWAVIDQVKGGGKGLPNGMESLYTLGKSGLPGFHDITVGTNTDGNTAGYPALVGYDLATGWGSPDLPNLLANWK